jgi:tetratricopeptide (TPR) repeat protein
MTKAKFFWKLGLGSIAAAGFAAVLCFVGMRSGALKPNFLRLEKIFEFEAELATVTLPSNGGGSTTLAPKIEPQTPVSPTHSGTLQSAWGKFQTGDFEGSIIILRAQLQQDPNNDLVRKNLSTALFALALVKIQARQWAEAEKLLEESEKHGNLDAKRTLASLKLKMGNVDVASNIFETLADDTKDPQSLKILVDLSLRNDELDRAQDFLAKLPQDDPYTIAKLEKLNLKRRYQSSSQFLERGGVEVAWDNRVSLAAAQSVLQSMESGLQRLSQDFFGLPNARLKAFLYASSDFFESTGAPPWAGGLFDGLISIPAPTRAPSTIELRNLAKTALHEMTHAYFFAFCGDTLPAWLGEGLAGWYEGRTKDSALFEIRQRFGQPKNVSGGGLDDPFTSAPPDQVSRLYAQSLLLIYGLMQDSQGTSSLKSVLSRSCVGRENLSELIQNEWGSASAEELWAKRRENFR